MKGLRQKTSCRQAGATGSKTAKLGVRGKRFWAVAGWLAPITPRVPLSSTRPPYLLRVSIAIVEKTHLSCDAGEGLLKVGCFKSLHPLIHLYISQERRSSGLPETYSPPYQRTEPQSGEMACRSVRCARFHTQGPLDQLTNHLS
jgi:hypothetical protein